jgi:hypothetical protein
MICFQLWYFIHFEVSNKIVGEDRFEGGAWDFYVYQKGACVKKGWETLLYRYGISYNTYKRVQMYRINLCLAYFPFLNGKTK